MVAFVSQMWFTLWIELVALQEEKYRRMGWTRRHLLSLPFKSYHLFTWPYLPLSVTVECPPTSGLGRRADLNIVQHSITSHLSELSISMKRLSAYLPTWRINYINSINSNVIAPYLEMISNGKMNFSIALFCMQMLVKSNWKNLKVWHLNNFKWMILN
jgi:hypothetical protein